MLTIICFLYTFSMFVHHPYGVFIVYGKVTKLIKWKRLYKWLLRIINRIKLLKTS
jgi:hypothetical protein